MICWIRSFVDLLSHVQGCLYIYQQLSMDWLLINPTMWLHDHRLAYSSVMEVDCFGRVSHKGRIHAG